MFNPCYNTLEHMARAKKGGSDSGNGIRISTSTIITFVLIVLSIIFLYFVREIIVIFLLALLLAALIDPFADWFAQFKLSRGWAVAIVYLILVGVITGLFFLVTPTLKQQTQEMFDKYGPYVVEISGNNEFIVALFSGEVFDLEFQQIVSTIQSTGLTESFPQILAVVSDAFGVSLSVILVFVLAFYLVVEEKQLRNGLAKVTTEKYQPFVEHIFPKAKQKTGQWLRGQLLIMFSIFVVTYVLLEFVLGVPFALVLALIAATLELVPFIGPILAAVPAIVIAFSVSPVHALLTALAYLGVQQFEGQILTPKIMEKVTGINPVFSILSVLIGFELVGPAGAILAIPVAVVVGVTILEWIEYKKKQH